MHKEVLETLRSAFGSDLQESVQMANFTTMNVGGPADALLIAHSADQLADMISRVWAMDVPLKVLGSGSNLLISDKGIRGVVIINHAHNIKINARSQPVTVWAESGALMINLGRQLALRGLSGMEWAATIPGTVGGAVYGNARRVWQGNLQQPGQSRRAAPRQRPFGLDLRAASIQLPRQPPEARNRRGGDSLGHLRTCRRRRSKNQSGYRFLPRTPFAQPTARRQHGLGLPQPAR
jgi:UDP-N-acetylmuramate dehydrogenase